MIISIHQPDYIPYLGYFYKIAQSDKFVYLDDCQFSNDNMHHWNKIKTPQGECRLKIPVAQSLGDPINKVRPKDELGWKQKQLKTIEMNYGKAPHFAETFPEIADILLKDYDNIADLNIALNTHIAKSFGFSAEFYRTSEMKIDTVREERVIDICCALGGTAYISGNGARVYQEEEHFTSRGVELVYTDYKPIEYRQQWKKVGFLPYMSVVDYIFNCGYDWDYVDGEIKKLNIGE